MRSLKPSLGPEAVCPLRFILNTGHRLWAIREGTADRPQRWQLGPGRIGKRIAGEGWRLALRRVVRRWHRPRAQLGPELIVFHPEVVDLPAQHLRLGCCRIVMILQDPDMIVLPLVLADC